MARTVEVGGHCLGMFERGRLCAGGRFGSSQTSSVGLAEWLTQELLIPSPPLSTPQAVAGSVLPDDDRRPSPLPLPPAFAAAAGVPVALQHAQPAAAAGAQPAEGVLEGGVQLPASFFSLLGSAPQQLAPVQPAAATAAAGQQAQVQLPGQVGPGPAGSMAGSLQSQPQQAAGLRALLFGGAGGGAQAPAGPAAAQQAQQAQQQVQPPATLPPPQQLAAPPPSAAGQQQALLSSATAADRWAWMGAFGGSGTAATGAAPTGAQADHAQQQTGGLPLPIPLGQPPTSWQPQQPQ